MNVSKIVRLGWCRSIAIGSSVLGLLIMAGHAAESAAPNRPNIVLIVADDLGFGDLGCYGATRIKTPNLDRLAAAGVRFTSGYAPSSTCTPTRYSMFTGEYGWRQSAKRTGILPGDAPLCIEPGRVTLPEALRRAGYFTGAVGRQHSGTIINGISRIGFMQGGKSARFKDEELTTTVVKKSVQFLESHGDRPFFLYVGLFEPHVPRVAEPPFVGSSELGVRGEVIQQMDWAAGEILRALDRLKLDQNTLVIFTSDNGPVLLGETTDNVRDHTVLHGISDTLALRVGDWKYIPANLRDGATGTGGANPTDPRFTPNQIPSPLLFNLREDPAEERNVIGQFPKRAEEMHRRFEAIRRPPARAGQG